MLSFDNEQTRLAWEWMRRPENEGALRICEHIAQDCITVIWELTSRQNRIVVAHPETQMRVLHIRRNDTGEYLSREAVYVLVRFYCAQVVPQVKAMPSQALALASLATLKDQEGYVMQFQNGEMLKMKCDWYLQLHGTVSFTRQRDIAEAALEDRLNDIKAALAGLGHDLAAINERESSAKYGLMDLATVVEIFLERAKSENMDRKAFALHYIDHSLFSLLMPAFTGNEPGYKGWYRRNRLKGWTRCPES